MPTTSKTTIMTDKKKRYGIIDKVVQMHASRIHKAVHSTMITGHSPCLRPDIGSVPENMELVYGESISSGTGYVHSQTDALGLVERRSETIINCTYCRF